MNASFNNSMRDKGRIRVLCVDDNRDSADSNAMLLELVGIEARASYNGTSAIVEAIQFLPDICLIDLNMPGMNGDELAIRLRALPHLQHVMLIAITAMSSEESRGRIINAGFHLHLVKPADPYQLVEIVNTYYLRKHKECMAYESGRSY